jgi:hypothetical protein
MQQMLTLTIFAIACLYSASLLAQSTSEYKVAKLDSPITIDADWNKPAWQGVDSLDIEFRMGQTPKFTPLTLVKMQYDDENVYVIFKVRDRFVRIVTNEINGPVWEDACAEFFFSPDMKAPGKYFNLEMTGGGTPLMCYNTYPLELHYLDTADIKKIEIAHSLPELVPNEITDSVTWTLEYKVPLALLEKYANVSRPAPGVNWMANFYKCASNNSNPHYFTWSPVINPTPNFHLPEFFGILTFDDATPNAEVRSMETVIYPNPSADFISLTGLTKAATLEVFNTCGSLVAKYTNITEKIDISSMKKGIYVVHIVDGEKRLTSKIIRQ